jgi:predicted dehydrogenase
LFDLGSHALDLVLWWFGEPESVSYEDDALGGVEVNCRVRMQLPDGVEGQLRLSRDWQRPNEYVIRCTGGWLRWTVNEAGAVQMGFSGSPYALDACIRTHRDDADVRPERPAPTFERSFVEQIRDVAAAHHDRSAPLVSGGEGLRALKLIETCYRRRRMMVMPWLSEAEADRARCLAKQESP